MKWSKRKIFRTAWFIFGITFLLWMAFTFQSRDLPKNTFADTQIIKVNETKDLITFESVQLNKLEIIFFPGGLVDPKAYAPLCRKIAENSFTCHIIKMSFRLAQRDYQKILNLFDLSSEKYIIGGHSQGAKMAAQFVYEHPGIMKGLFLMGTTHPRDIDLSHQSIPTLKIYAENDGLASIPEVLENKDKLPKNTEWVLIEGGNHSQFGYMGRLLGDHKATISREEQQSITAKNMLDFFKKVEMRLSEEKTVDASFNPSI